jgi:hypothetical protein
MRCGEAMFRGKFIVVNFYIKKEERIQINNQIFHFVKLETEKQLKSKAGRRKERIKIRIQNERNKK